jgi:flagellar hook-length control protein FliK
MTSGVKQALPQVLMPKTGAESKAARNRAPQSDFADALALPKAGKQPKQADAKADRSDSRPESRLVWPHLASKLDIAIDRTQVAKLEPATQKKPMGKEADKSETHYGGDDAEEFAPLGQAADAATTPVLLSPSPSTPGEAAAQAAPQRHAARFLEEPPVSADPDVIADGSTTFPLNSSDESPKQERAAPVFMPMGRSEQAESIPFEPAAGSAAPSETADEGHARASPDNPAEPTKTAPRVTVLAQQSIPAPMPQTSVVLVESIAASDLLQPARSAPALDAIHASATHASAQSLKIQLHPAELGMVTATLRFAGEQLSIELQVENHDAYRRLSNDSETIVSSLRDLGYDVERVTILQPSLATASAGRSDTGASMPSPQGRAAEQFGSGAAGGGNGGSGGRQPGEGGNAGRNGQSSPTAAREQQGSGLYI